MAKINIGKAFKGELQGAVNSAKAVTKNVKMPDVKAAVYEAREALKKNADSAETKADAEVLKIKAISARSALKIMYYLMAADGEIFHSEEEKFDAIGRELDPDFENDKAQILEQCRTWMDKLIDPEDHYDLLQDGIEEELYASLQTTDSCITPRVLVWDMLTVAYSDNKYDDVERKLIKYVVRKTGIDKAIFLEMESSLLTLMDIERELEWIKTTNRPYLVIEGMVNELADRKNVIFESIKDLLTL